MCIWPFPSPPNFLADLSGNVKWCHTSELSQLQGICLETRGVEAKRTAKVSMNSSGLGLLEQQFKNLLESQHPSFITASCLSPSHKVAADQGTTGCGANKVMCLHGVLCAPQNGNLLQQKWNSVNSVCCTHFNSSSNFLCGCRCLHSPIHNVPFCPNFRKIYSLWEPYKVICLTMSNNILHFQPQLLVLIMRADLPRLWTPHSPLLMANSDILEKRDI